jgi:flagellar M-ring protein FliF
VQNAATLWTTMDLRRRLIVGAATLGMFLAILGLARLSGTPQMALLYAGLDGAAAGEVVAALEARGVAYEVRGDSIRVDAALRDELRMTLAAEGLPAQGSGGYELLDGLSGFGTTSQMFDAAYWRAKEGELARTILAMPGMRAARVHIAQAPTQPFQRDRRPTAGVTVTTATGGLSADQARALRHLVAAAVSGMRPEDVAVVDSAAGLIPLADDQSPVQGAEARAAEIKRNVERLLAARVGPGRAVVEVAVDVVTESESLTERRFDPQGRVAISSETEERSDQSTRPEAGVTVASNLPEGDAGGGGTGQSQSSQTRERINYEVSETSREVLRVPGAVRRLSVAVLIDGETVPGPDGTPQWQPRPEAEMSDLRDLVASAVGFDEARGDVLTLRSLPFQAPPPEAGTLAEPGWSFLAGPLDVMTLVQTAVLALVALVLGLFVLRPILAGGGRPGAPPLALPGTVPPATGLPEPQGSLPAPPSSAAPPATALTGEIDDGGLPDLPVMTWSPGADPSGMPADPVERLRRLIDQRQAESIEILRGWMEAEEDRR